MELQLGDIVVFKRKGPVSFILGGILKLFERDWDAWGWHVAFVSGQDDNGWNICEALAGGVAENPLSLYQDYKVYRWFDEALDQLKVNKFVTSYLGKPYDIAIYFWTTLAVIIRHYWNKPISKLLDERYSCWELTQEFTMDIGKPILSRYDVVIITDIMKSLEGKEIYYDAD